MLRMTQERIWSNPELLVMQNTYGLCLDKNIDFLQDKCIWTVTLSDDSVVYQDDSNPSLSLGLHHSSWIRLSNYLKNSELTIKCWRLQFRDNVVELPTGIGYVYSHGVIGTMSGGQNNTFNYHIVGAIQPNTIEVERFWFHSPALICTDKKRTKLSDLHTKIIIWNNEHSNEY